MLLFCLIKFSVISDYVRSCNVEFFCEMKYMTLGFVVDHKKWLTTGYGMSAIESADQFEFGMRYSLPAKLSLSMIKL